MAVAGTGTACRLATALSIAAKFFWTIALPFRAYVRSVARLIASIALSRGITPESAKKHVCRIVFTRDPRPRSEATLDASMTCTDSFLAMICCCTSFGSSSQTASAGYGLLIRTVAPGAAALNMSSLKRKSNLWMPTKFASLRRYGARMGCGPKRRCEIV